MNLPPHNALDVVAKAIRTHYLPGAQEILREHEEFCRTHPHVAQFLASLPNGGWRTGTLAGLSPGQEEEG